MAKISTPTETKITGPTGPGVICKFPYRSETNTTANNCNPSLWNFMPLPGPPRLDNAQPMCHGSRKCICGTVSSRWRCSYGLNIG